MQSNLRAGAKYVSKAVKYLYVVWRRYEAVGCVYYVNTIETCFQVPVADEELQRKS